MSKSKLSFLLIIVGFLEILALGFLGTYLLQKSDFYEKVNHDKEVLKKIGYESVVDVYSYYQFDLSKFISKISENEINCILNDGTTDYNLTSYVEIDYFYKDSLFKEKLTFKAKLKSNGEIVWID